MKHKESINPGYLSHSLFAGVEPELLRVPADQCRRGMFQTRLYFDDEKQQELDASIATTQGNVMPAVLRPTPTKTGYEIIAGERRQRSCLSQGFPLLALVADYTDEQAATIALIENVQRDDLTALEEAEGYQRMIDELSITHQQVADLVGKSRTHVTNALRLLKLDTMVKDSLNRGVIDVGHAKMLAGLPTAKQRAMLSKIRINDWTVRRFEKYLREKGEAPAKPPIEQNEDRDIAREEERVSAIVGSPVSITFDKDNHAGEIRIQFWGPGNYEGIIETLTQKRKK